MHVSVQTSAPREPGLRDRPDGLRARHVRDDRSATGHSGKEGDSLSRFELREPGSCLVPCSRIVAALGLEPRSLEGDDRRVLRVHDDRELERLGAAQCVEHLGRVDSGEDAGGAVAPVNSLNAATPASAMAVISSGLSSR